MSQKSAEFISLLQQYVQKKYPEDADSQNAYLSGYLESFVLYIEADDKEFSYNIASLKEYIAALED